jgi:hypothetical protein
MGQKSGGVMAEMVKHLPHKHVLLRDLWDGFDFEK